VLAASGDLPFGSLSAPGAGMMPKLAAGLMMLCAALIILGARTSERLAADWSDRGHAALVVVIAAAAVTAYRPLGFLLSMAALVFALLALVERRNLLIAAGYSIGLTLFAYWLFGKALKSPLERGLLWF
jgi:Tripartite tricarboxylate transporter TctB family